MFSSKSECGYCKTLNSNQNARIVFNRALFSKYCDSQNYFYVKLVDVFLGKQAVKKNLDLKELIKKNHEKEYLIAFFKISQYKSKMSSIIHFYRFVIEIPRFLLDKFGRNITMYHDAKRQLLYTKLKKNFGKRKEKSTNPLKSKYLRTEENEGIKERILQSNLFKNGSSHYNISNTLEGLIGILPEIKNQSNLEFSKMMEIVSDLPTNNMKKEQKYANKTQNQGKIHSKVNYFKKYFDLKSSIPKFKNEIQRANARQYSQKVNNFTQLSQNSKSKVSLSPSIEQRKTYFFNKDKKPQISSKNSIYSKILSRKRSTPQLFAEKEREKNGLDLLSRKYSQQFDSSTSNKAEFRLSKDFSDAKLDKIHPHKSFQTIFQKFQGITNQGINRQKLQNEQNKGNSKVQKNSLALKNYRAKTQSSFDKSNIQFAEKKVTFPQGLQGDVIHSGKLSMAISMKILSQKK